MPSLLVHSINSIGRWEPVCITLRNSKSGPLLLLQRVIQTGSHRPGRITAEIHQSLDLHSLLRTAFHTLIIYNTVYIYIFIYIKYI